MNINSPCLCLCLISSTPVMVVGLIWCTGVLWDENINFLIVEQVCLLAMYSYCSSSSLVYLMCLSYLTLCYTHGYTVWSRDFYLYYKWLECTTMNTYHVNTVADSYTLLCFKWLELTTTLTT